MDTISVSKKLIAFGSKKIFLPKFTIALIRTPHLSPYHARFLVPRSFSKYDLRDYLYHAYNTKCFNIRSFVKQQPVRDTLQRPNHWFRPEAQKYMTVEMEKPFVWPEAPETMAPWDKEDRERQVRLSVENAVGRETQEDVRGRTKRLREAVEKLVGKTEDSTEDEEARRKSEEKGLGMLGVEIAEERQRAERIEKLKVMSRSEFWEEQRTPTVIESEYKRRPTR